MIKNIVFDLGRVLISFEPEQLLQHLLADPATGKHCSTSSFRALSGSCSIEVSSLRSKPRSASLTSIPKAAQIQMVLDRWLPILTPIESSVELVRLFKEKGLGLYVISNFHRAAFDYIWSRYPWLRLFDGMVISCETQTLKLNRPFTKRCWRNTASIQRNACSSMIHLRMWKGHAKWACTPCSTSREQIGSELEAQFQLLP